MKKHKLIYDLIFSVGFSLGIVLIANLGVLFANYVLKFISVELFSTSLFIILLSCVIFFFKQVVE